MLPPMLRWMVAVSVMSIALLRKLQFSFGGIS